MTELLNENIGHDDLKKYLKEFYNYASKELCINEPPRLFLRRDQENAGDFFGKTGGYDPDNKEIHLYISGRHPKDIVRSFAHELIHHMQKLNGLTDTVNLGLIQQDEAYAQNDDGLKEMERQAFEEGNMLFRKWTDMKKGERKKIMSESKKPSEKTVKDIKKSVKKTYPEKSPEQAKSTAIAIAKNIKKGMVSQGPGKPMKKQEEAARLQAEADAAHLYPKKSKEENATYQEEEGVEALQENEKNDFDIKHPYPKLLEEKPRLLQDAYNKKEEIVYQELIRRFIKK